MHKKSTAGKKTGARSRALTTAMHPPATAEVGGDNGGPLFSHIAAPAPTRVSHILSQQGLSQLKSSSRALRGGTTGESATWLDWMRAQLPAELAAHLVEVLPKSTGAERELLVFADSPTWCARLRYALMGIEGHVHQRDPAIRRLRARVLMPALRP